MDQVGNPTAEPRPPRALLELLRAGVLTIGARHTEASLRALLPDEAPGIDALAVLRELADGRALPLADGLELRAEAGAEGRVFVVARASADPPTDASTATGLARDRATAEEVASTATGRARDRATSDAVASTTAQPAPASAAAGPARDGAPADAAAPADEPGRVEILHGDNMSVLPGLADASFRLIYIDPPFNTRKKQSRLRLRTRRVESGGDRTGYHGARYETTVLGKKAYADSFDDYLGFLEPRLRQAHRLLTADGSLFLHLDYREVHYAKVLLDDIFGRDSFQNEIIWAYDYGARTKKRWSAKHDNILWYTKSPTRFVFNYGEMDRIPYMAPGLVGAKKAARGKTPTDVWWHTIVSPSGKERTGYPTQKPVGVLRRIVRVHSRRGDRLLDFFAGSGSFGEAGAALGRLVTLVDINPEAVEIMRTRLERYTSAATAPSDA